MYDHRLIGKVHNWLGHRECEGPQSCAISSDQDQSFHAVAVAGSDLSYLILQDLACLLGPQS